MKILNTVIKMEHCELHKATDHSTKCDLIYAVKQFPAVYLNLRIYCCKFLTLFNQKSRYKCKCIRKSNLYIFQTKCTRSTSFLNFVVDLLPLACKDAFIWMIGVSGLKSHLMLLKYLGFC